MTKLQQGRSHRILLLERDDSVRGLMHEFLLEEGYQVSNRGYSLDPADLRDQQPDLIILDIPKAATSLELDFVRQVKADSRTAHIPILGLCRLLPSGDLPAWSRQNGIAGVIRKPFDLDDFLDAVHAAIESANVAALAANHDPSVHQATPDAQPRP